jgi:hypothetical protein
MRIIFVICLLFLSLAYQAFGQNCPIETGYVAGSYFSNEIKRVTIHKFNEVPLTVSLKAKEQLVNRVGEKFLSKLKFSYGYAVLFENNQAEEDFAIQKADAYILVFVYSNRNKGIKEFRFDLVLNADGSLFRDIYFPNLANDSNKANIISCQQAIDIASQNGFQRDKVFPKLEYDGASDSFVWVIADLRPRVLDKPLAIGKGIYKQIEIDAVTSKVLKIGDVIIII